ncbi:hypothetical protein HRF55_10440 [Bacillus subtilis]|uniref:hypothetical protein n=1 Tax=Bacillus subtilis TaxID=1423 RepID=UPI0015607B8B|nr:hypothetical protein [Bacillus subtilis]NRF01210.1 hypothetical protein [Bacillus subtilis]NRG35501.1 hypothetical protein [Bacillus subtilis]
MAKLDGVKTLDMVNGEITKVAYGGTEYERVEGAAEVGDIVLITTNGWTDAREGEFYKAVGVDSDGDAKIKDDRGTIDSHFRRNYDIFRKVAAINPSVEERVAKAEGEIESLKSDVAALKGDAEPKPDRLKVGDYAKVVGQAIITETGDIVKIIQDTGGQVPFMVETMDGKETEWRTEESLVRATDEEVAEAKREAEFAKFKEGDKVRLKSGGGKFPLNGYENGKVYEVGYVCFPRDSIRIIGGNACQGFATPDQLEILSEEEAAEHKKWAEFGREIGEYKVGDIFRSPNGILYEVTRIDDRLEYPIRFTNLERDDDGYAREAKLTLVTPVEARFDR